MVTVKGRVEKRSSRARVQKRVGRAPFSDTNPCLTTRCFPNKALTLGWLLGFLRAFPLSSYFARILVLGRAFSPGHARILVRALAHFRDTPTRGIELWFPHSTLKFSVRRLRRFQISQTRKILPPGGCVCTLHDNLGLATLFFLKKKKIVNLKKWLTKIEPRRPRLLTTGRLNHYTINWYCCSTNN